MKTLRHTVKTTKEFLIWAAKAMPNETVTYHIGSLGCDRLNNRDLHEMAEAILLLTETGYVVTSQSELVLTTGRTRWYAVTRTGRGTAPRSVMLMQVLPDVYRAIVAVSKQAPDQSTARAIRDTCGIPEQRALDLLAVLHARKFIEEADHGKGWRLTPEGALMIA